MTETAYTIGFSEAYDSYLLENPDNVKKLGERQDYEGGYVWLEILEAKKFLETSSLQDKFSIYELKLPNGKEMDISKEPSKTDGVHRLINDSLIIKKIIV